MEIELSELREKNGELNQIVEEALMARKTKEDEVKRLQSAVAEQKKENAALINSIDPEMRDAYEQLKEEAEGLKAQVREKQKDLQEVAAAKAKLDEEVAKSPLKHEAVLLYERLNELITKKNDIEREMKSEGTPEDLRERFVDQIKKINEGIGVIQKQ
ncbi:hypothetical protein L596_002346 [Steinernema carpocapsae]|nr:hypothetical protein L596_002346 [Steinernema carpocapsae]